MSRNSSTHQSLHSTLNPRLSTTNTQPSTLLDRYYAAELGCRPEDFASGKLVVVTSEVRGIRFAKGVPLAVFGLGKPGGSVISARSELANRMKSVVDAQSWTCFDDAFRDAIERAISPMIDVEFWFRGRRLFCEPSSFVDREWGTVCLVSDEDEHGVALQAKWGGDVFGQIVDGRAVAWAAVKPLSDTVWDLSVETMPDYRGRGFAASVVSAAVKSIFARGKLAGWGTDQDNIASLRTAHGVGFTDYCLDFGCVER